MAQLPGKIHRTLPFQFRADFGKNLVRHFRQMVDCMCADDFAARHAEQGAVFAVGIEVPAGTVDQDNAFIRIFKQHAIFFFSGEQTAMIEGDQETQEKKHGQGEVMYIRDEGKAKTWLEEKVPAENA